MAPEGNAVSFLPKDFVQGGAVPNDINVTYDSARFVLWDYQKKSGESGGPERVALKLVMKDDEGNEHIQYYSAADPRSYSVSEDGKKIISTQKLVEGSNFDMFVGELVNAGFSEAVLAAGNGDISVIEGTYAHHIAKPEPSRPGLVRAPDARPKVVSVPNKVLRMPGEKAAGKGATKAAEKSEFGDADAARAALKFVSETFEAEKKDSMTKQQLTSKVFKSGIKGAERDAIVTIITRNAAVFTDAGYEVTATEIKKAAE